MRWNVTDESKETGMTEKRPNALTAWLKGEWDETKYVFNSYGASRDEDLPYALETETRTYSVDTDAAGVLVAHGYECLRSIEHRLSRLYSRSVLVWVVSLGVTAYCMGVALNAIGGGGVPAVAAAFVSAIAAAHSFLAVSDIMFDRHKTWGVPLANVLATQPDDAVEANKRSSQGSHKRKP
jgi:hypothetical protein